MPVYKRKYRSGKVTWYYMFSLPESTRLERSRVSESGFSSKREAEDAEARRRIKEQQKLDLAKTGAGAAHKPPTTLEELLQEFFLQHVDANLAPKTVERYHEQAAYLQQDLLSMPIAHITPLHLHREWVRLAKCGGHTRKARMPRALSAKTVRNIAGVVSSAFARAIRWGLISTNPVTNSEPPRTKKHYGIALSPAQQEMVLATASGPWCLPVFLEVCAGTGARRGEVLALRWTDIYEGRATLARSLSQTKQTLDFKGTKSDRPRVLGLPASVLKSLEAHRRRQDEFRQQFGPDYKSGDLIFCTPDGSPLMPDSVSAAVSLLFRRLKLPKGASLHSLRQRTHRTFLRTVYRCRLFPPVLDTLRFA
jgi:integrase